MSVQTVAQVRRSSWVAAAFAVVMFGSVSPARAQWLQWGQNAAHTSFLTDVPSQPPNQVAWQFQFDLDPPLGEIDIHYGVPLVLDDADDGSVVIARRHDIGGGQASYDVVKLDSSGNMLGHARTRHRLGRDAGHRSAAPGDHGLRGRGTDCRCQRQHLLDHQDAGRAAAGIRDQIVKAAPDGSMHADLTGLAASPAFAPLNAGAAIAGDGSLYVVIRTGGFPNDRLLGLNHCSKMGSGRPVGGRRQLAASPESGRK